jgi:2-methylcitrate dehydratase PrpD
MCGAAQLSDVPVSLVDDWKIMVLDTFGADFVGAMQPWAERLRATMQATEAAGPAAVRGPRLRFSASTAVMLNGTAVHGFEQAASLMFTPHGGMGKRLLAGQAARAGTFAALLAEHGFTNADNVFEAEYGGFCTAHTGNHRPPAYDLTQLTKNLGSDDHTLGANFKMWARRVPNHAT